MTGLPAGDRTPADYRLPAEQALEPFKRLVRRYAYPAYNAVNHARLSPRYSMPEFRPDLWLRDQRGNDFERHRRRVSRMVPVAGRRLLVAGCGTGRDVESWVRLRPRRLDGVDWFSYERAWALWRERFLEIAPDVEIRFAQADLADLADCEDGSIDIVSSDAVLEHLPDVPAVLREFHRVLRPGGILYATFGPLWFSWGGDHVSGYDGLASGYNHLLLEADAYRQYLEGMGAQSHSEHDGRTWIQHGLFSRLTPAEYLRCLDQAGFRRRFVGAILDPNAEACLADSDLGPRLLGRFARLDLLVSCMTVIYER